MIVVVFLIFINAFIVVCGQLTFMVLGDWGGTSDKPYTTDIQLRVASAMGDIGSKLNSSFVVSVGDNFYDEGVESADDKRWKKTYEEVYTYPSLQTKWYITAGNRDYYGNVTALLAYTSKSTRWWYPSRNYDEIFPIPNTNCTLHLIMLDTFDMTSSSHEKDSPPQDPMKQIEDYKFIEDKLSNSNATWVVLTTHFPIFSAGAHGPNNTDLINNLLPLVLNYKPDLYLAGHDHDLQHIQVFGQNYFIVGSGSQAANSWDGLSQLPEGTALFTYPPSGVNIGGFGVVKADASILNFTFYDDSGKVLYYYTLYPQNRTKSSTSTPTSPTGSPTGSPPTPLFPPVITPSSSPLTPGPTPTFPKPSKTVYDDSNNTGISSAALYGIIFGVIGGVLLVVLVVVIFFKVKNSEIA